MRSTLDEKDRQLFEAHRRLRARLDEERESRLRRVLEELANVETRTVYVAGVKRELVVIRDDRAYLDDGRPSPYL